MKPQTAGPTKARRVIFDDPDGLVIGKEQGFVEQGQQNDADQADRPKVRSAQILPRSAPTAPHLNLHVETRFETTKRISNSVVAANGPPVPAGPVKTIVKRPRS